MPKRILLPTLTMMVVLLSLVMITRMSPISTETTKTAHTHFDEVQFLSSKEIPSVLAFNEFQESDAALQEKIQMILADDRLRGAVTGISVRHATDGRVIYEHQAHTNLHPASNMKILTGAAALEVLGPNYQFSTEIWADGKVDGRTLHGDLYLKGKGDPTLLKKDFDQFAIELKEQGIHHIHGNVYGDDSWYDDVRYSQDLNWNDETNYTGAAVSALTVSPNEDYDTGSVIIFVRAGEKTGEKPHIEVIPQTDYVNIINNADTTPAGSASQIHVDREHGTNNIIIDGTIPVGGMTEAWRAVWEPTMYALHLFKDSLQEQGIELSKNATLDRKVTPEGAHLLVTKPSMPLRELLIPFMKLSNNGHGETLVKEMGKVIYGEGSWDAGLKVLQEQLVNLGMNKDHMFIRDGSGMSHKTLIQPTEMTKLLYEVQKKGWFKAFKDSQPVAGEPNRMIGGSLSYRLTDETTKGKVQAKTGTLTGVNTLSGYLTTQDEETLIFSIMINNFINRNSTLIIDAIVKTLIEHQY